ncbi:alpha/beta hydrolase-fold protein [Sphingomonas sp. ASV193]|uniref:alpha/beta hydrolase n=1 Tax=Sphingomonas sp. ASV193 TaxID=3144405 RepID=UPI0032E8A3BF
MKLFALLIAALLAAAAPAAADPTRDVPVPGSGQIVDLGVLTPRTALPRRVVVWLPSGYDPKGPPYAVLYMHDGQNLFDDKTAGYGHEWMVDETLDRLIREKKVRPTIVVGIWNTPKRLQDYVPAKAFARLPRAYMDRVRGLYGGDPLSDGYLKFIVDELRPAIARRFNVATDRDDTFVMGSSMGGLISLYAIDEYPAVFGGAGMLSTHWPLFLPQHEGDKLTEGEFKAVSGAFTAYLATGLADPRRHRLYFDHGTETLDAEYARYQQLVDRSVAAKGYIQGDNWLTVDYPGEAHNEQSWASRLEIPLRFLLRPKGVQPLGLKP